MGDEPYKKKYKSGNLKCTYQGRRILYLHKRAIRVVAMSVESCDLRIPRMFILLDMIKTYKKLSDGLECGLWKFDDACEPLKLIEDHLDDVNFDKLFKRLRDANVKLDEGLWEFCVKVGFIDDEVTRAAARAMSSKLRVEDRANLRDWLVRDDRRVRRV